MAQLALVAAMLLVASLAVDAAPDAGSNASDAFSERPLGYSSCTCQQLLRADGHSGSGAVGDGGSEVHCTCASEGPVMVQHDVHSLTVSNLKQETLHAETLKPHADSLRDLFLKVADSLRSVDPSALRPLRHLRTLDISEAPRLATLPDELLDGVSPNFKTLRVVRSGLQEIPRLQSRDIVLHMIDLESNNIKKIDSNCLQVKAELLVLSYNALTHVAGWAFNGSHIARLILRGNRALQSLSLDAFAGLRSLHDLDLSDTAITVLPTRGLGSLEVLRIQDTASLTSIPSIYYFEHLQEAWLTYSFHCCAFHFPARHDPDRHRLHQEFEAASRRRCRQNASTSPASVAALDAAPTTASAASAASAASGGRARRALRDAFVAVYGGSWEDADDAGEDFLGDDPRALNRASEVGDEEDGGSDGSSGEATWDEELGGREGDEWDEDEEGDGVFHGTTLRPRRRHHARCGNITARAAVSCQPAPNALNPCEDIMGLAWLRACVWVVLVTAVLGNGAVLVGLLAAPRNMAPGKFLMCNLAFADLCMGLYLLLLAAADAHSHGEYFNFAFFWQRGPGCRAAGFLTVFASQLSVYTLAVLTLERWVAITYALYMNKRLKLRATVYIMAVGWAYALSMAALPLAGVSSYSATRWHLPAHGGAPRPRRGLPRVAADGQLAGLHRGVRVLPAHVLVPGARHTPLGAAPRGADGGEADGAAGVHRLRLLGAHLLLRRDGRRRPPAHRRLALQDPARLLLPAQLVRQPLPVRAAHQAVPPGRGRAARQTRTVAARRSGEGRLLVAQLEPGTPAADAVTAQRDDGHGHAQLRVRTRRGQRLTAPAPHTRAREYTHI